MGAWRGIAGWRRGGLVALLVWFCLIPARLWAQPLGHLPVRAFGFKEGLEDGSVSALVQDEDGFIWAGTETGLFRFDGERFERRHLAPGYDYVTALVAAPGGRLWVGTRNGLGRLDTRAGTFVPIHGLEGRRLSALGRDAAGGLFALSGGRLYHSADGRDFQPRWDLPGTEQVQSVFADPSADRVVATIGYDLWILAKGATTWVREHPPLEPGEDLLLASLDGQGHLWAWSSRRLYRKGPTGPWARLAGGLGGSPPANTRLTRDRDGWVWVNTASGLFRCQGSTSRELRGTPKGNLPTTGLIDREGNPWLAADGLFQVLGQGRWEHNSLQEGLPSNMVWHVLREPSGRHWLATDGGLVVESPQGWKVVRKGPFSRLRWAPDGSILAVGSPGGTLYRVNPRSLAVEVIRVDCLPASPESRGLAVEPGGRVWVSDFRDGVALGERVAGHWTWTRPAIAGQPPKGVWQVLQDPGGVIFLATAGGVYLLEQGQWQSVGPTLPFNPFSALMTASGEVWVCYWDRSFLTRHRREGGVWKAVEEWHPFPTQPAMPILGNALRPDGRIWVGTTRGLGLLDPAQHRVDAWIGPEDGIPGVDANNHALVLEPGGDLWYGTTAGVGRFRTADLPVRAPLPLPILLQWRDQDGLPTPGGAPARLQPGEALTAHFALNAFSSPSSTTLEARVEGVDLEWVRLRDHRLRYAGLPSGQYRLEVRGQRDMEEPGPSLVLAFRVLPRWWQTWWALLLGIAGLALAGVGVGSYRHRALARHNLELQQEVASRTQELSLSNQRLEGATRAKSRFIATMSHELRTPLNAILLYTELLAGDAEERQDAQSAEDLRKVQSAGNHLLATINGILDLSRIEAGAESVLWSQEDIQALVHEVADTLSPLAKAKGISLLLEFQGDAVPFWTDATKLRQVLTNLGGNACKFTAQGRVLIATEFMEAGLRIQVLDTGKGMTPQELSHIFRAFEQANDAIGRQSGGTGLGLTISRRLVELLGGSISVTSTPGKGSTFTVDLPALKTAPV